MSRSVYRPPFLRQILPWIYVLVFLLVAPVLIFYTAGYRYNLKKGVIERNGTLIVDTTPSGAEVFIDDQDTHEKTPISFQNMAPGWHRVRVQVSGYSSWEKNLEVRAERVTFANNVWLWKKTEPSLAIAGHFDRAENDLTRDKLFLLSLDASATAHFWSPSQGLSSDRTLVGLTSSTGAQIRWRDDGRALVVNGLQRDEAAWLVDTNENDLVFHPLTAGFYRWESTSLVGINGRELTQINPDTENVTRQALTGANVDQDSGYTLQTSTSTNALVLLDRSFRTRAYSLPNGNWQFGATITPFVVLKDQDHWLALHTGTSNAYGGQTDGDAPRWLFGVTPPRAIMVNGTEIWTWPLGTDPTLIWRQSDPVVQAAWHRSGTGVFAATKHDIFAIGLDDRDGRLVTPLATFNNIYDFGLVGQTLYISADKDGQSGLWSLQVE